MEYNKNPKTYPPEIDEDAGEVLCDECKGSGCLPITKNPQTLCSSCWKCKGSGKLDWVSFITGKPSPKKYDDMADAMAYATANTIDKEIIDNILNAPNKHIKNHDQEGI